MRRFVARRSLALVALTLVWGAPLWAQVCPGVNATEEGTLAPVTPSANFAGTVSLSGDWAVVGRYGSLGEASFFERTGGAWVRRTTTNNARSPKVSGNVALIGRTKGLIAAEEFTPSGTGWAFNQKLNAAAADNHDDFGWALDLRGNMAAIGAPDFPAFGFIGWGGIEVHERVNGNWIFRKLLIGPFSPGVGRSALVDGRWVLASGINATGPHAVVFDVNTQLIQVLKPEGLTAGPLALSGNTLAVGASTAFREGTTTPVGKVFLFDYVGGQWVRGAELQPADLNANDRFGSSGSMDGDRLVVSATGVDLAPGNGDGAAYVFQRVAGDWVELGRVTKPTTGGVGLGRSVSLDGDRVVLGGTNGKAYVFHLDLTLPPTSYCTAGTTASGCNALLSSTGTASRSSATGFVVAVGGSEGQKDGTLYFGTGGPQANSWGNGTSLQCVVPPVTRTGVLRGSGTFGACDGALQMDFNAWMAANPSRAPQAGETAYAQAWFRDPMNTSNQSTSLSNALAFTVCP
jgi:hypothetical protein